MDIFFGAGLGKQSRSMFMEMDANAARTPQSPQPQPSQPRTPEQRSRNVVAQVAQVSSFCGSAKVRWSAHYPSPVEAWAFSVRRQRVSFASVGPVFQIRRTRFDADSLLGFAQLSLTRSDEQVVHERAVGIASKILVRGPWMLLECNTEPKV